jgi:ParB/RepB/Spo0J family partition protein
MEIPVSNIEANPYLGFEKRDRSNLQESIKRYGLLQNLIVRPHPKKKGKYELIAGAGRLQIAKENRVRTIPAVVRRCDHRTAIMLNAVENFNRADLSAIQQADLIALLVSLKFKNTEIARELGISRAQVDQRVKLEEAMRLHEKLRGKLNRGLVVPSSIEYVYSAIENEKVRHEIIQTVIDKELNIESTVKLTDGSRPTAELRDQADDYKKQEEGNANESHRTSEHEEKDAEGKPVNNESKHQKPQTLTLTLIDIARGLVLQDGRVRNTRSGRVYDLVELLRSLLASKVHAGDYLQVLVKQTIRPTETVKQAVHA